MRIFLGGLFAAALVAAGEWMRRKEIGGNPIYAENAHIPSILTAAGTTVAYATIYAAYALYGFLVPGTAFVLLGIVALATLAAALLHGPALAALGQIGAFVVPALVASDTPNYWALYIYLAFVSAGSFALARVRLWRWLVITAVAFGTLWMFVGLEDTRVDSLTPHALHVVASFALAALMIVSGLFYGPEAEEGRIDPISSGAVIASLLTATVLTLAYDHAGIALSVFTLVILATVAVAWRTEAAVAAVPVAGAFAALIIGDMAVGIQWTSLTASGGPAIAPDPSRLSYGTQLTLGFGFSALFAAAGFLAQGRAKRAIPAIVWAATAVIVPLAILIALYYRIYGFERALPFAALALLLAALFAVATEMLTRREPESRQRFGRRNFRHRLDRGARACAHLRAGERLAHRRARPDGAGHGLGCRAAPAAVAALAVRHPGCAGDAAHRLRAAHRRRRDRHDADLQLDPLRLRHSGDRVLGRGLAVAQARRRCALAHGRFRRDPVHGADRLPGNPPLPSTRAISITPRPASPKSRCKSAAGSRWRSDWSGCAAAPTRSCMMSRRSSSPR